MGALISYEAFNKAIENFRKVWDFEERANQFFGESDIDVSITWPSAEQVVLDLLCEVFEDESDWIGYWVFELDFGRKYDDCSIKDEETGRVIPLKTTSDLYDFLVENYVKNHSIKSGEIKWSPEEDMDW